MTHAPLAIVASFALAIMLTLTPLPEWAQAWRPEWVALALVYWTLMLPRTVGIGLAWLLGLLVDAARDGLVGEHALGLAIVAYITLRLHHRLRLFPLHQQAIFIGLILLPYKSATLWIKGVSGYPQESWLYWAPVPASMLAWPLIFSVLQATTRRALVGRAWSYGMHD